MHAYLSGCITQFAMQQSQVGSEGSDLSAKDSSVIALHLAACASVTSIV